MAAVSGFTTQTQLSTISFIEGPADCSRQRLVWGHTIGREVARGLLGRDLDLRIRRHKLVWNGNALNDLHALANERVVFHVAHRNEPIDSPQAKPMDHVRHKLLEPDVLAAGTGGALGRAPIVSLPEGEIEASHERHNQAALA